MENKYQQFYDIFLSKHFNQKYGKAGVYCIMIDKKILYIGESAHMDRRIRSHVGFILGRKKLPKTGYLKYQYLQSLFMEGKQIEFAILEETTIENE